MRRRSPGPLGAAFRSVLIPGWGQLATRHTTAGKILVFITGLACIGALAVFLFVEPVDVAAWLVDPNVILGIVLFNPGVRVVRLFATRQA